MRNLMSFDWDDLHGIYIAQNKVTMCNIMDDYFFSFTTIYVTVRRNSLWIYYSCINLESIFKEVMYGFSLEKSFLAYYLVQTLKKQYKIKKFRSSSSVTNTKRQENNFNNSFIIFILCTRYVKPLSNISSVWAIRFLQMRL